MVAMVLTISFGSHTDNKVIIVIEKKSKSQYLGRNEKLKKYIAGAKLQSRENKANASKEIVMTRMRLY